MAAWRYTPRSHRAGAGLPRDLSRGALGAKWEASAERGVTVLTVLLVVLGFLGAGVGLVVGLHRIGPTAFRLPRPPLLTAERTATLQEALNDVVARARLERRGERVAVVLPTRPLIHLDELAAPEGDYHLDVDLLTSEGEAVGDRLLLVDTSVGMRALSAELPAFVLGAFRPSGQLRLFLRLPSGVWTAERAVALPGTAVAP